MKKKILGERSREFTFAEVCSGAGGLSKGFIDIGFQSILLNDTERYCVETLKLNHGTTNIFHGSMLDIPLHDLKVDVLMGGVPCQSFSQAGKREGVKDDRGQLLLYFLDMIKYINPSVFVIENVPGLVTHNNGKTLKSVIDTINALGTHKTTFKVLNANDYGVPQNRKRLFIVGVSIQIQKKFSFPIEQSYKPVLRDAILNCPKSEGAVYNKTKYELFKLIPEGGCWVDLPVDLQRTYMKDSLHSGGGKRGILKRLDMNKPCLTLLTTPSQKQTERCHPYETRPLQILEYARIQSFPDDYKFAGTMNQKYKQIGNAVPVLLSRAIATEVLKVLTT